MNIPHKVLAGFLVMAVSGSLSRIASQDRSAAVIESEDELAAVIAELNQPETHLKALSRLVQFAQLRPMAQPSMMLISGDPKFDALEDRTQEILNEYVTPENIGELLASSDPKLQWWALSRFKTPLNQGSPFPRTDEWLAMVPSVETLMLSGDAPTRAMAGQVLVQCPGTREFLDSLVPLERSIWVLTAIVTGPSTEERDRNLNARLVSLLRDSDEAVRIEALAFVGTSHNSAPVCQTQFDVQTVEAVSALTRSKSEQERWRASYALAMIHGIDPVRSRTTLVDLAKDSSGMVRRWVAFGLADQLEVPEVQAAISALLDDPLPSVQYSTIWALGPEKFVRKLRELAVSHDPETAKNAAGVLRELEQKQLQR